MLKISNSLAEQFAQTPVFHEIFMFSRGHAYANIFVSQETQSKCRFPEGR